MYIKYKCTVVSSNCGAMVELQATFSTKNIHYQKKKKIEIIIINPLHICMYAVVEITCGHRSISVHFI